MHPFRKPSSSAGLSTSHQSTTSSAQRAPTHRSTESHNLFSGSTTSQQQKLLSVGVAIGPQYKIVTALVNRLKNKLPHISGSSLDYIEADPAIQQATEALADLTRDSPNTVLFLICQLLEPLTHLTSNQGNVGYAAQLSREDMQSELFVLKVLTVVMAARWPQARCSSRSSHRMNSFSSGASWSEGVTSPSPSVDIGEPVAINDNCAKYVLSNMIVILKQCASPEGSLLVASPCSDLAFREFASEDLPRPEFRQNPIYNAYANQILRSRPSSISVKSGQSSQSSIAIPVGTAMYEKTHISLLRSQVAMRNLIMKLAGQVIFYLSATNWNPVFHRLRSRIHFLANATDEIKDTNIDLELLYHCALDRSRLVQVLNELSSLLVNMKQDHQLAIAVPLRTAIWNWIRLFPAEFNDAIRQRGRLEGAPERVFDLLYTKNQLGVERSIWPTLLILNCISSDRLMPELSDMKSYGRGKATRKDTKFYDDLFTHGYSNPKTQEVGLACALDLCRAASYVSSADDVPLRLLAYDVAHEIKNKRDIFDAKEEIDVALCAEVLVATYRFLPEEDSIPLFLRCCEPERSEAFKACAARAFLTLVQESVRVPWQKPLDKLRIAVAPRFREIYKTASMRKPEVDAYGNLKRLHTRPKARRVNGEPLTDREVVLLSVIAVWRTDPELFVAGIRDEKGQDFLKAVVKLWDPAIDASVTLAGSNMYKVMCDYAYSLPPEHPDLHFLVSISKHTVPSMLVCVSASLLGDRLDTQTEKLWLGVLHGFLDLYMRKTDNEHLLDLQQDPGRIPGLILTEVAFLVCLASADNNASNMAARGLRLLAHLQRDPEYASASCTAQEEENSKRELVYDQLGDPKITIVGRVGHQKRIRKLLRLIAKPCSMHIAVWEECYWRWRHLTELLYPGIGKEGEPPSSRLMKDDQRFQWRSLTLFLAALGGACIQEGRVGNLSSIIPLQALPDKLRVQSNSEDLVQTFINDVTNMLLHPDVHIRDTARDALGMELNHRLHGRFLKHIEGLVQQLANTEVKEVDAYYLLMDQVIVVLKLLIDSLSQEDFVAVDMASTMLSLGQQLPLTSAASSARLKIKFCQLCDSLWGRPAAQVIKKDNDSRLKLLDLVVEWMQVAQPGDYTQSELNMAALRTMVVLLDHLQIRPPDDTGPGDENAHVVARLFAKYSSALLQSLEICHMDFPTTDSASESGSIQFKMKASQREAELRDLVITGLSHLVISNSESGFKQCLSLAYSDDNLKRTIFSHVFARVLGQGARLEVEETVSGVSRISRLAEMALAMAICEVCPAGEVDTIINVLLDLFDTREHALRLIKQIIDREIANTTSEASLFRSNSMYTRFLSAFARKHGYHYLRGLIEPLIRVMEEMPPDTSFELDPAKAPGQDPLQNQHNIELVAGSFLNIVSSSTQSVPRIFREVCAYIADSVMHVWPEAKFAALGAFVFLRFISPAIVSPEVVDVEIPKTHANIRRGLMVVAKVIQNLANNIFFGKEQHMTVLNKFLERNIANVTRFLSELHKISQRIDDDQDEFIESNADSSDVIVLHRFFHKHADKIGKELLSIAKPNVEANSAAVNGKHAWDDLCGWLVDLGQPMQPPQASTAKSHEHGKYIDLLSKYASRTSRVGEDIFIPVETIRDRAVYVFRLSRIDVEGLDVELLMAYILKHVLPWGRDDRDVELIFDCTAFSPSSEIPLQWLSFCLDLVPADVISRIKCHYILNPNQAFVRYMRKLCNMAADRSYFGETRVCDSLEDLKAILPDLDVSTLEEAARLEDEPAEVYQDVSYREHQSQVRTPITLYVGATHMRITFVRRCHVSTFACKCTDIMRLTDISDVYNVAMGTEQHEFIMRKGKQGVTMYFSSQQRDAIIKSVRTAKGRMKDVQAPSVERFARFSNKPATLLHIGLLSVDVNDEELRAAAYDLLGAVCTYLNYDKNPIIAPRAGFVPGEPTLFARRLSDSMAQFAPQLTLDFISEVSAAMNAMRNSMEHQLSCLLYMSPWVKNLSRFTDPTSPLYDRSTARVRDCIRTLAQLSINFPQIAGPIQRHVWSEIGKLDNTIIEATLDELIRIAADGGVGTSRCETISLIVASFTSIHVRGKLLARLRKVLSRAASRMPRSLHDHPYWNEISALVRLVLVAGYQHSPPIHNQVNVPEIVHLCFLLAGIGPALVRKSVYGIVLNLLQGLYLARLEEGPVPMIKQLMEDMEHRDTLQLFGLARTAPTSEYSSFDFPTDKERLDAQEKLVEIMIRVLECGAPSVGLLNVFRARWMSLVTSSAFQLSPVQMRCFTVIGALAKTEVDEDLFYQMLVALRTSLSNASETDTITVVSILRCMCRVIPEMSPDCRYPALCFWLGVGLLQSSYIAFYEEAAWMVRVSLETLDKHEVFGDENLTNYLLNARSPLEETACQLDGMLKISFDSSFSFSLAAIIFKGFRHTQLVSAAESVLRTLMEVTVKWWEREHGNVRCDALCPDALGYFAALVPVSTTAAGITKSIRGAHLDHVVDLEGIFEQMVRGEEVQQPLVGIEVYNISDETTALLASTFIVTMLSTAQGDDVESEILFGSLAEIAAHYPQVVVMVYDSLQERVKDSLALSANPSIIRLVADIFRAWQHESAIRGLAGKASSSTLGTVDETASRGPSLNHIAALEELGMAGLADTYKFLPRDRGVGTAMIQWIPELVDAIIRA
ncbi:hypothetical protein EV714DRAFT_253754 [Schizophyllum commune]